MTAAVLLARRCINSFSKFGIDYVHFDLVNIDLLIRTIILAKVLSEAVRVEVVLGIHSL